MPWVTLCFARALAFLAWVCALCCTCALTLRACLPLKQRMLLGFGLRMGWWIYFRRKCGALHALKAACGSIPLRAVAWLAFAFCCLSSHFQETASTSKVGVSSNACDYALQLFLQPRPARCHGSRGWRNMRVQCDQSLVCAHICHVHAAHTCMVCALRVCPVYQAGSVVCVLGVISALHFAGGCNAPGRVRTCARLKAVCAWSMYASVFTSTPDHVHCSGACGVFPRSAKYAWSFDTTACSVDLCTACTLRDVLRQRACRPSAVS